MNYSTLAAEISLPQYAGMSDEEIAAALNAVSATTRRAVPLPALLAAAALNGSYAAVKAAAESEAAPAQVRGVCASVLVLMSGVFKEVNLDDPRVHASLGALAQAGVLTAAQMTEIDALADVPGAARWQALGLAAAVTVEDIQAARDWQEYEQLVQRVQAGVGIAAGWLYQQRDAGAAVPEWSAVLERM